MIKGIDLIRDSNERIGLLGGTFNPIHKGHVRAAQEVLQCFNLDRIYFIPSARPPHKPDINLAAACDRYAMVDLELAEMDALHACDAEIRRTGPSYSVDTVAVIQNRIEPAGELYFLLGVDAFLEIDTWKSHERLLAMTAFVVMTRPPHACTKAELNRLMAPYIKEVLSPAYTFDETREAWMHPSRRPIFAVAVSPVDIASSQLREKLRCGEPTDEWLSPAVARYIKQKGLYR